MSDPKRDDSETTSKTESPESAYSPEYLRECADGTAREERLAELKRRIELGAYRVDASWIADEILQRGALDSD